MNGKKGLFILKEGPGEPMLFNHLSSLAKKVGVADVVTSCEYPV